MAITIDGSSAAGNIDLGSNGTITDLAVGGLPNSTVALADLSATGTASSSTYLRGDNTWAALSTSGIKQIVQTSYDGTTSNSTATETLWDLSGTIKRDITTTSNSSKVLVFMNITLGIEEDVGSDVAVQVTRQDGGSGSFDLIAGANGATAGNRTRVHTMCNVGNDPNNTWRGSAATVCYLDAPGNAGDYSYSFKLCHSIGSTETLYINRTHDDTDAAWTQRGLTNIICAEFY